MLEASDIRRPAQDGLQCLLRVHGFADDAP
jgi:hypothetical protein